MKLQRIQYAELNSRQQEIFNFQKVAGLLADFGFNCIKLADDWQGEQRGQVHFVRSAFGWAEVTCPASFAESSAMLD